MTDETKLKSQDLLERLHEAREELAALEAKQRNLPGKLEQARLEDHEERMEASRAGRGVSGAVSSILSKVRGVRDRGEEMPSLIWSARLQVLELEAELCNAQHADLEGSERKAHEEFIEADKALPIAECRRQDALDRTLSITRERRGLERRR